MDLTMLNDLVALLQGLGVPTETIGEVLKYGAIVVAIAAFLMKYLPPPPDAPTTWLGKVWAQVYPIINFVAQNSKHATNAKT